MSPGTCMQVSPCLCLSKGCWVLGYANKTTSKYFPKWLHQFTLLLASCIKSYWSICSLSSMCGGEVDPWLWERREAPGHWDWRGGGPTHPWAPAQLRQRRFQPCDVVIYDKKYTYGFHLYPHFRLELLKPLKCPKWGEQMKVLMRWYLDSI